MGNQTSTISIPASLAKRLRRHPYIDWESSVLKELMFQVGERDLVERILISSKMTGKEAKRIGQAIKKGLTKRYYGQA